MHLFTVLFCTNRLNLTVALLTILFSQFYSNFTDILFNGTDTAYTNTLSPPFTSVFSSNRPRKSCNVVGVCSMFRSALYVFALKPHNGL
jgi:hypothetical protein